MISAYVQELKPYSLQELSRKLGCEENKAAIPLLRKLKEYGVLKTVRRDEAPKDLSDLQEEDEVLSDVGEDENIRYVFAFVGILVIAGRVLNCYPKYLKNTTEPKEELRQVLRVLQKYRASKDELIIFSENAAGSSANRLAVILFLMQDYMENGLYTNPEEVHEINGDGEIQWERTIERSIAWISHDRPYYTELFTRRSVPDEDNYFTRLHKWILTQASRELTDANLLELFDLPEVELTDEDGEAFGEKDVILYQLEKELNSQFVTGKQQILKAMRAYLREEKSLYDKGCFALYGTNHYNLVWEEVCSVISDNQLRKPLNKLNLPVPLQPKYKGSELLIEVIEKPLWTVTGRTAKETLIPDIVTIEKNEDGYRFIISDAKYYTPVLNRNEFPQRQPGIESVTKQYLYQLAFQKFAREHGFIKPMLNCFLLPTEKDEVEDCGEVELKMLNELGLENIKIRFIPAKRAYQYYLTGKMMKTDELLLN